jgi:molybdate transport system substrate-binding protein
MTDLTIVSGGAMRTLLVDAAPMFERASGTKVDVRFALTSVLMREIERGAVFDLALLPRPDLDALARHGSIAAGTPTDITRSAIGLCVRAGAPKPDIGSVDAFRHTLLQAKTLGYSDGPSGAYVTELLARLGIAERMKPNTRLTSAPVAELVASGNAEIGIQQIVAILPIKGVDLVGPLPGELQNVIIYAAGISARAANEQVARAFMAFLATPEATDIMRAKGLEPG